MSRTLSGDRAGRAAAVLRGFGLERSDLSAPSIADGPLRAESVATALPDGDDGDDADRLAALLAGSTSGIDADRDYPDQAPAFQVGAVLGDRGYEFGADPIRTDDGRAGYLLSLDGDRRVTFHYPPGPFGENNYPALVYAVETQLLARPDLAFVRLVDDGRRWRFALVGRDRLADLRERFGDRIAALDRPLLARRQPVDFAAPELLSPAADTGAGGPGSTAGTGPGTDPAGAATVGPAPGGDAGPRADDPVDGAGAIDEAFETLERETLVGAGAAAPGPADDREEAAEVLASVLDGEVDADADDGRRRPRGTADDEEALEAVVDRLAADPAAAGDADVDPSPEAVLSDGGAVAGAATATGTGTPPGDRDPSLSERIADSLDEFDDPGGRHGRPRREATAGPDTGGSVAGRDRPDSPSPSRGPDGAPDAGDGARPPVGDGPEGDDPGGDGDARSAVSDRVDRIRELTESVVGRD